MTTSSLNLLPIGYIRTPFRSKYDAPRQPRTARRKTVGRITLHAGQNFEQGLEDLQGFDFVWIIFWFDQSTGWKPKVLPPSRDRKKRGVFSTRSPHRPNPLGLSLCRLREVKGRTLVIENPDLLDGTPVFDIKPYIPHSEAIPDAASGWIAKSHENVDGTYTVTIRQAVLDVLRRKEGRNWRQVASYVRDTLSRDPEPHSYRRIKQLADGSWRIAVRRWRFLFEIRKNTVIVSKGWKV